MPEQEHSASDFLCSADHDIASATTHISRAIAALAHEPSRQHRAMAVMQGLTIARQALEGMKGTNVNGTYQLPMPGDGRPSELQIVNVTYGQPDFDDVFNS